MAAPAWTRRKRGLAALLCLDAAVVAAGTFGAWLIVGFADFDQDVPGWLDGAILALGVITVAAVLELARRVARGRDPRSLAIATGALQLGLAVATIVALGSVLGAAALLAGAVLCGAAVGIGSSAAADL